MTETYVECMVKHVTKPVLKVLVYFLWTVCAIIGIFSFLINNVIGLIIAIGLGVGAYFLNLNTDIEYEYLYCDKEITVDKVLARSKRKRVDKFDVGKIEILAPINSYHLDDYKNRQAKVTDFSSGVSKQPDHRFVFFYEGQKKIIIEPSPEFVKAVYNVAPRKVFTD